MNDVLTHPAVQTVGGTLLLGLFTWLGKFFGNKELEKRLAEHKVSMEKRLDTQEASIKELAKLIHTMDGRLQGIHNKKKD